MVTSAGSIPITLVSRADVIGIGSRTEANIATVMNLSHVIHEFSFGPYFPKIIQPLDNSV